MKRLLFLSLLFTLNCTAMELTDANQQKAYQELEQARSEYCQALTSKNDDAAAKKSFLQKQNSYAKIVEQHNQKVAQYTKAQQLSPEQEEFEQLCDAYAQELKNAAKEYTIIDKNGKEFTLSPSQHLTLLTCETYENVFTNCGHADFSNQYAPASATKDNILTLINCIETKKECNLLELADYLGADQKLIKNEAERLYSAAKAKGKNNLSFEEKRLKKMAKKYLFYETLEDFLKDYRAKKGTDLKVDYHNNDLAHRSLKKLGFYKKIKSLAGLDKFLHLNWWNDVGGISNFDISGHAITTFALDRFYLRGQLIDRINLSNNEITTLTADHLRCEKRNGREIELVLDNNPLTSISDCTDATKIPQRLEISLKNIPLTKEMLKQLPPLETSLDKLARKVVAKYNYLDRANPKSLAAGILISWASSIGCLALTVHFHDYLLEKVIRKKDLLSDAIIILHASVSMLAGFAIPPLGAVMLIERNDSNEPLTKFTTDHGVHLLKKN